MDTTAAELLAANLHGVFGERDPERRRATAAATYTEYVQFSDPEETVVGPAALEAKAAALLEGPRASSSPRRGRSTRWGTAQPCPGRSDPGVARRWPEASS